ncbi:DUF1289 domain-containing protein [Microvirga sp. 2MCAF38]|uniref:DUF1289 domain-containing protein n=1 Tax=Microvirga sp. 2MCAF38 TaxID=3232989 RepID=UPI003F96D93B
MTLASSPCIRVCLIDPETGLCEGCGRTREEIGTWYRMTEEERLAIMAILPERMRAAFAQQYGETDQKLSREG